jgi:5-methyltetrahydrofolate--homocysteine methyltransferase
LKYNNLIELLGKKILLADGAMGTELQKRGMQVGVCPEELNVTDPQLIKQIYKDYFDAGSDIITTNTFGANSFRLKFYDFQNRVEEFNLTAVNLAKEVRPEGKFIAGSIGPLGELIEPLGEVSETAAYNSFKEQAIILEKSGADIIFLETMMALEELIIAIHAVKENTSLPVSASMTFELGKAGIRTPWGVDVKTAVEAMEKLKVDIIGSNCGKGFDEMIEVIKEMKRYTDKPILAQSNAGIPVWIDGLSVYTETPEFIAEKASELISIGAAVIGGCCGTSPDHIKNIRKILQDISAHNIN